MDAHDELEEGESLQMCGVGGWLLLVAVGRILAVPAVAYTLWQDLKIWITPGIWHALTDPDSEAYHPLWSKVILYETAGNALLLLASIVIAVLIFSNWRIFPKLMIAYLLFLPVFAWIDYALIEQIDTLGKETAQKALQVGLRATLGALIWVPYFLVSERVKGTYYR